MATTETILWTSDDDYLCLSFTLIYDSKNLLKAISVELSLADIRTDTISKNIPISGIPIALKHHFDNGGDIEGEIQLRYQHGNKRTSHILAWGNFSFQHPDRKKRNYIEGGLINFNYDCTGIYGDKLKKNLAQQNKRLDVKQNNTPKRAVQTRETNANPPVKEEPIPMKNNSDQQNRTNADCCYQNLVVQNKTFENLFPYIQLSPWQSIDQQSEDKNFVEINLSDSDFYQELVTLKKTRQLTDLLSVTENFISHSNTYVNDIKQLHNILKLFPRLFDSLKYHHPLRLNITQIEKILSQKTQNLTVTLQSPAYGEELDKIWQSYLALTITLKNQYSLYAQFSKILIIHHLLTQLLVHKTSITELHPHKFIIILPTDIFPLPHAQEKPIATHSALLQSGIKTENQLSIYAIGYLHMIKRRLLRYELAEIHHIENLLKGEKKVIKKRTLNRTANTITSERSKSHLNQSSKHDQADQDLWKTLTSMAATQTETDYQNIDNNYGSPTVVSGGNAHQLENIPDHHNNSERNLHFARNILNKASHHFTRQIQEQRCFSEMNETEETISSYLDNTFGKENILGIYRWLNKIYQAQLISYGKRLMLEFVIAKPGDYFIDSRHNHHDLLRNKPTSPSNSCWKINTHLDITPENVTELAAYYELNNIEPAPVLTKTISANLQGEQTKNLSIPHNYVAETATISPLLASAKVSIQGIIGKYHFYFDTDNHDKKVITLDAESLYLSVTMTSKFEKQELFDSNVLIQFDKAFAEELELSRKNMINVDIKCTLSDQAYHGWQIRIYDSITQAYQQQKSCYYQNLTLQQMNSAAAMRAIINDCLKISCKKTLIKQQDHVSNNDVAANAGHHVPAPPGLPQREQYAHFFENSIEWQEMTYSFIQQPDLSDGLTLFNGQSKSESPVMFDEFLQAQYARVLVPVAAEHLLKLLYYLNTGYLWSDNIQFIPCHSNHISIIHHLLCSNDQQDVTVDNAKSWEITIPTTMQILQNSMDLPVFEYDDS